MSIRKTVRAIKKHRKFLITSHVNPEGDSLGSQLAMAHLLSSMGKSFCIFNHDRLPGHYQFLPKAYLVQNKLTEHGDAFDAAIVLDCPNLRRTGRVKASVKRTGYILR